MILFYNDTQFALRIFIKTIFSLMPHTRICRYLSDFFLSLCSMCLILYQLMLFNCLNLKWIFIYGSLSPPALFSSRLIIFKIIWGVLTLNFYMNFRIRLPVYVKTILPGRLVDIVLKLRINEGRGENSRTLSLPIQEHSISLLIHVFFIFPIVFCSFPCWGLTVAP